MGRSSYKAIFSLLIECSCVEGLLSAKFEILHIKLYL